MVITEIACIEYLDTSVVLPVKGGHGIWAACINRVVRVVEPQTQVVKLDRISRGIGCRIRKLWVVERCRSGSGGWGRNDESLDTEPTYEPFMTDAIPVRLNIALVPGKAKWRLRYLDHKEIKVSVGRQPPNFKRP